MINYFSNIYLDELETVDNIGEKIAYSIKEFFNNEHNRKILLKFKNIPIEIYFDEIKEDSNIFGKVFVFTGTLPILERDECKNIVKNLGGVVSESVSKNTNYVVAGESAGSKLEKAKELGINILDEEGFKKLLMLI